MPENLTVMQEPHHEIQNLEVSSPKLNDETVKSKSGINLPPLEKTNSGPKKVTAPIHAKNNAIVTKELSSFDHSSNEEKPIQKKVRDEEPNEYSQTPILDTMHQKHDMEITRIFKDAKPENNNIFKVIPTGSTAPTMGQKNENKHTETGIRVHATAFSSESKMASYDMDKTKTKATEKTSSINQGVETDDGIAEDDDPSMKRRTGYEFRRDRDMNKPNPSKNKIYQNFTEAETKRISDDTSDYVVNITIENIDVRAIMEQNTPKKKKLQVLSLEEYAKQREWSSR